MFLESNTLPSFIAKLFRISSLNSYPSGFKYAAIWLLSSFAVVSALIGIILDHPIYTFFVTSQEVLVCCMISSTNEAPFGYSGKSYIATISHDSSTTESEKHPSSANSTRFDL